MNKEEINRLIEELSKQRPDSFEFGNSKAGKCKVYVNIDNLEESETRINQAIDLVKKGNVRLFEVD